MKRLGICLLFIMCLFITGCGEQKYKEVSTLDNFTTITSNMNFTVNDISETYKNANYILEAKKALYEDIVIEMIQYTDSDYAEKALETHIESFELLKSTGAAEKEEKGENYHKFVLISNGRYMISTRVENTLIFTKVLLEDRETVESIINEMGY